MKREEFEDGVDFINMVFSQNSVPHDFKNLMPKWIREDKTQYNVIVKRDGRIRANIMAAPADIRMAGHELLGYGIGNVSTHLDERRQGFMRMAMTRALDDIIADGADLIFLGGQRQRYGYYGFDRCGIRYNCTIEPRNFRHVHIDAPAYSFEPLTGLEDPALLMIRKLYEAAPVRVERGDDADFYRSLIMWRCEPSVCRNENGDFVGYLCTNVDGDSIMEAYATEEGLVLGMLQGWFEQRHPARISMGVAPWRRTFLRELTRMCDSLTAAPDHSYRILHWDRVTQALMDVKAGYCPLPDGLVVLEIGQWGRLALQVKSGRPECAETKLPADAVLTEFEAMRALFGPAEPGVTVRLPEKAEMLLDAWCPLPLSWHSLDNV